MTTRETIVATALKEVGNKEVPAGSNKTTYGEWFGLNGLAWCGIFVSWVYWKAGKPLPKIGFTKGFAGCQTMHAFAKSEGMLTLDPKAGDVVLYDWNGDGRFDHTGVFTEWSDKAKGKFRSIEGNTSFANQSNGGEVMLRDRNVRRGHYKQAIFVNILDNV